MLLENQYGDQKVVTVPAKWNVEILSKIYRPEYVPDDKDYKADENGKVEVVDKEDASESEKVDIEVSEEISIEETEAVKTVFDETVAGFNNTEEDEDLNAETETAEIENADESSESLDGDVKVTGDEFDSKIDDSEVVYEYEELKDDSPIVPDDDELDKTDLLKGNAKNGVVNKDNAEEEGVASLDLEELASELGKLLGRDVEVKGDKYFGLPLLGANPHSHWVCGRAACSDTAKNHFNENMETLHPENGTRTYQAINTFEELKAAIASGKSDNDYLYLTASISVTEMVKITRPLYLCLNDYKLSFKADGQLCTYFNEEDPTLETLGTYPYAICICGCNEERKTAQLDLILSADTWMV